MLDGFIEGRIAFEGNSADLVKARTKLEAVLRGLI